MFSKYPILASCATNVKEGSLLLKYMYSSREFGHLFVR